MSTDNGGRAVHGAHAEPGLRERKKLATRQALSAAAMRLALEQGFDNVRVEDIAEAAGVSPRTFNNYFSSREEAIVAARTAQVERMAQALLARPAEESLLEALRNAMTAEQDRPRESIRDERLHDEQLRGGPPRDKQARGKQARDEVPCDEPTRDVIRLFLGHPTLHAEFLRSSAQTSSPMIEAVARRTGTSPDDLLPNVVTSAALGALRAAMQKWLADDDSPPLKTLLRDALNQLRALTDTPEAAAPPADSASEPIAEPATTPTADSAVGEPVPATASAEFSDVSVVSAASAQRAIIGG